MYSEVWKHEVQKMYFKNALYIKIQNTQKHYYFFLILFLPIQSIEKLLCFIT